jgi:hypothetical protein
MNPSQAPNEGDDPDDPLARDALTAQQQRDLALLLQQQHQRATFHQALLAAAAQQRSTLPGVPMYRVMNDTAGGETMDAVGRHSALPSAEFRDYTLESERQNQRVLSQQQLHSFPTADFQRELFLDVERQRIQNLQQQSSQQQNLQRQLETSTLLQQNLGRLLAAGLSQESINAASPSVLARSRGVDNTELDRLLATESLLRRSRLQEAVNMLQNQGILLEDAINRDSSAFSNAPVSSTPWFPNPNDPILSQLLQSAASNCASVSNRPTATGSQNIGHLGLLPGSISSIEGPRDNANSAKRIPEEEKVLTEKEAKKQKATRKAGSASSFPLPSRKHSRKISMKLSSFHALWNKLGDCALRQELFRRRLSRNLKTSNKTVQL